MVELEATCVMKIKIENLKNVIQNTHTYYNIFIFSLSQSVWHFIVILYDYVQIQSRISTVGLILQIFKIVYRENAQVRDGTRHGA